MTAEQNGIGSALEALEQIGKLTVGDIDAQIATKKGEISQLVTLRRIAKAKEAKAPRKRKKKESVAAE